MCLGIGMNGPRAPIKRTSALSVTLVLFCPREITHFSREICFALNLCLV